MEERPITPMQIGQIAYGALFAARMVSGYRIPPWEMLRDDQKIWFSGAITREEEPRGEIPGLAPITSRDEAIIGAIRGALATK